MIETRHYCRCAALQSTNSSTKKNVECFIPGGLAECDVMALFLTRISTALHCSGLHWACNHLVLPLLLLAVCCELRRVGVELPLVVGVDHVLVLHHCDSLTLVLSPHCCLQQSFPLTEWRAALQLQQSQPPQLCSAHCDCSVLISSGHRNVRLSQLSRLSHRLSSPPHLSHFFTRDGLWSSSPATSV